MTVLARFTAFLILMLPIVSPLPAAAAFDASKMTDDDRRLFAEVDRYLRAIRSMQSRFVQLSSNGDFAEGLMFLRRPGRMRIEYHKPDNSLIVADGKFFTYYDAEAGQATHVYLKLTPASILLDKNLSLTSKEILVVGFERAPGVVRAKVARATAPDEATITLVFNESPLALRKWTVLDAQGITTDVSLVGARFDMPLPDDLFIFDAPEESQEGN